MRLSFTLRWTPFCSRCQAKQGRQIFPPPAQSFGGDISPKIQQTTPDFHPNVENQRGFSIPIVDNFMRFIDECKVFYFTFHISMWKTKNSCGKPSNCSIPPA